MKEHNLVKGEWYGGYLQTKLNFLVAESRAKHAKTSKFVVN
jgi:hypothetical protein